MLKTSERVRQLAEAQRENRAELSMLQARLRALPQASRYSDEELDKIKQDLAAFGLWQRKQAFEKLHPSSTYHRQQLLAMQGDWTVVEQAGQLHRVGRGTALSRRSGLPELPATLLPGERAAR